MSTTHDDTSTINDGERIAILFIDRCHKFISETETLAASHKMFDMAMR
jgi:hypothetical protein